MKQISQLKIQGILAKIVFAFLSVFLSISVQAQTEIATAKSYLTVNATKQKLSTTDIAEMNVSSAYLSPTTGWYHIYFNQTYQSVEVYNGLMSVTVNNGQVGYVANSFVANLASQVPSGLISTKISPIQALQKAATSVNLTASNNATEVSKTFLSNGTINKISYIDPSISNENIDVKLYWLPYESIEGKETKQKVVLTWNVRIPTKDGKNVWNMHVDALSGNILQTYDDVIHCNFGTPEHNKAPHICIDNKVPTATNSKALLGNTYNVFDYPLEAPTFGARTVVTSPYTKFVPTGTGPGATNGWHDDGTTSFTNTKGNNVDAKDDIANDNEATIGSSPSSATLDFNFPYTQATGTAAANLNAAITNMYYWNNVMHDVLWKFGFDEPGGNFQKNNLGRGGAGNDFVFADAQDGSGTNNANFATPADGSNPRMQMFIFSNAGSPAYTPDSDFDNGVIAHEYGHGWSNRLTGGPAIVNCLQNAEQAGEGWSDYVALMTITDWSALTPTVASANIPRGIGTYVLGQPTNGAGIRPFPYSYDKTNVNNIVTYAGVGNTGVFSQPHGIGSIWATMLWDMTWEIILQDNQIVNNIYTVPANITDYKGNIAALKLVNEGLRLQPCSPSFVQSRDAILQADQMLFGGRYRCAISRAFTRRGLGALASTGASSNDRIVTEDFTPISGPGLNSPNSATVCSNSPFAYTATTGATGTFSFAWTRAAVAGISNPAGSATSANINETLINTTNSAITVIYYFTISPDACGGTPAQQPVTVIVNPTITPTVAAYTVCQNASVPSGEGLAVAVFVPVTTVNGIIASGSTYVRGAGDDVTIYSASRPVFYKTYTFIAPAAGAVTFATTAAVLAPGSADDTYLTLYQTSFNPASPATNFLRGDDDSGVGFLSSLTQTLTAGTTYIVVVSTFSTGATGTFTLQASTAVFGQTVNWYLNPSGGSPLATGAVFNPVGVAGSGIPNTATLGSTTFYVADALYPDCRTAATFTIGNSVGGAVTADATVCTGSNSGTLTLAGHTGSILRWESSIDNFVTTVTIANTTTTQPYSNLTQTTKYRAVVQLGTCTSANSTPATITTTVTTVTASSNSPVTVGGTINLNATTTATTFIWAGPNSFTSTAQNPAISSATTAMAGIYTVSVTSTGGTCMATATTNVVVNTTTIPCSPPTGATAGSNSPVTVGSPINLTSSSTGGTSQVWGGPNSFASTAQNPIIASATVAMAGDYTVTITSSGTCTAMATVNVVVNTTTIPCSPPTGATAGSNSPVTVGSPINLTSSSTGGTSQIWAGPSSFSSTDQNPTIASATSGMAGIYTVTITSSGTCTAMATVNVVVNTTTIPCSPPTGATAGSNSPVTVGSPINLTSSSTGGTSQVWAGPSSFSSTDQNPTIASATSGMAGIYTVTITSSGTCTAMATVNVVVNPLPTGAVVFVNIANIAAPVQNGNSWATAYGNLQTALASAPASSEIWVAQGTYKPTNTSTKTISFTIPSGTMVYGGFVGTEISQNQRNFTANPTILSGEIGTIANPQDNSYHVVFFNGANNTTRLDGFTIREGNSNYTVPSSIVYPSSSLVPVSVNDGGGIALDNGSSPVIINCKIINNKAYFGAGIFATNNSNPTVTNCIIMGNESTFGGGVYHIGSNGIYNNVLIAGNKAIGGGMYNNVSSPSLTNVTIAGNGGNNGAIFNSSSSPIVKNCILWGNISPFNDTQSITSNSIVEGGYPGIGNLNLNPQLANLYPYGLSPNILGDYQLTNTSPAIDAGDNGTISLTDKDLTGNLRRYNGGIVDMGAYEFQGSRVGGTVISIVSGNWESSSTWDVGRSPLAGDNVIINNNHNVTILNLGVAKNVEIRTNAKIIHSTTSSKLQTGI